MANQIHPSNNTAPIHGWIEAYDGTTHHVYYYNTHTAVTTWDRPHELGPPPAQAEYIPLQVVHQPPHPGGGGIGGDIPAIGNGGGHILKTGDTDINDMTPCLGFCCVIASCYTKCPDCIGCATNLDICCIGCELYTCKRSRNAESYCQCAKAEIDCNPIKACIMIRGQNCCLDVRCSIPPSEQIPCLLTCCFLTCCYNCGCMCSCCTTVAVIKEKRNSK